MGRAAEIDQQRERLAGELGDVWHYSRRLALATGITPADLLVRHRARIEGRLDGAADSARRQ
jgi:hypothetical protein